MYMSKRSICPAPQVDVQAAASIALLGCFQESRARLNPLPFAMPFAMLPKQVSTTAVSASRVRLIGKCSSLSELS